MPAGVTWTGLAELMEQLGRLPEELAVEGERIIQGEATYAAFAIRSAYPVRTGNLRDHVTVSKRASRRGDIVYVVKSSAKHATIFEYGTQARHTRIGANRGAMPPGRVFIPIVIRGRRVMFLKLADLLVRKGFIVVGDAAA